MLTKSTLTSCTYTTTSEPERDSTVFIDAVSEFTPVVVTVTGGLYKLGSHLTSSSTAAIAASGMTEDTTKESPSTEEKTTQMSPTATVSRETTTAITDCK